jgi:hypothetical protein
MTEDRQYANLADFILTAGESAISSNASDAAYITRTIMLTGVLVADGDRLSVSFNGAMVWQRTGAPQLGTFSEVLSIEVPMGFEDEWEFAAEGSASFMSGIVAGYFVGQAY